jgi:2-oxoglutarate ferredoxin oxidoreductase subunit gamma
MTAQMLDDSKPHQQQAGAAAPPPPAVDTAGPSPTMSEDAGPPVPRASEGARLEIRFAGFGGQGIVSAGRIAGQAVVIYDRRHAVMTQNYGPEARGGACAAEVVVSDMAVDYPNVNVPDVAVIMSQEAYAKYGQDVRPGGTLLLDQDLVEHEPRADVRLVEVPATRLAEGLGRKIVSNVVMLGALAAANSVVSREALLKAVLASVPPRTRELNERAFEAGYLFVKEARDAAA